MHEIFISAVRNMATVRIFGIIRDKSLTQIETLLKLSVLTDDDDDDDNFLIITARKI